MSICDLLLALRTGRGSPLRPENDVAGMPHYRFAFELRPQALPSARALVAYGNPSPQAVSAHAGDGRQRLRTPLADTAFVPTSEPPMHTELLVRHVQPTATPPACSFYRHIETRPPRMPLRPPSRVVERNIQTFHIHQMDLPRFGGQFTFGAKAP